MSSVFGTLRQHENGWRCALDLFDTGQPTPIEIDARFDAIDAGTAAQLLREAENTYGLIRPDTEKEFRRFAAAQIVNDSYQQCDGSPSSDEITRFANALELQHIAFCDEACLFVWRRTSDSICVVLQTDSELRVQKVTIQDE